MFSIDAELGEKLLRVACRLSARLWLEHIDLACRRRHGIGNAVAFGSPMAHVRCELRRPGPIDRDSYATNISGCEPMLRRGDFKQQFYHSMEAFRGSVRRLDLFRRFRPRWVSEFDVCMALPHRSWRRTRIFRCEWVGHLSWRGDLFGMSSMDNDHALGETRRYLPAIQSERLRRPRGRGSLHCRNNNFS